MKIYNPVSCRHVGRQPKCTHSTKSLKPSTGRGILSHAYHATCGNEYLGLGTL